MLGKCFILCQRMLGRADAGDRGRTEFSEVQGGLFLPFFCAESSVYLFVFDLPEKGREGNRADRRAQQRELQRKLPDYRGQQAHFHMVVASDFERDKVFVAPQALFCGQSGFQDKLSIGQEHEPFFREGNALARPDEKFYAQFFLQCLDLMADCGLRDLKFFGCT